MRQQISKLLMAQILRRRVEIQQPTTLPLFSGLAGYQLIGKVKLKEITAHKYRVKSQ